MLRPDRMTKVSITGPNAELQSVIETLYDLNLLHLSDYDGSWEDFENGDPLPGAEEASEQLVVLRALMNTLDIEADGNLQAEPPTDDELETRLGELQERVNEVEDKRDELREDLRTVDERIERVQPYAALDIDLSLLGGFDTIDVVVGEGDVDAVQSAVEEAEAIEDSEFIVADDVVAIIALPAEDADAAVVDALTGIEFTAYERPAEDGDPAALLEELESERADLTADIDDIDDTLDSIADESGDFLRGAEQKLSMAAERGDAPLQFATTEHAFVAEGWIPSPDVDVLEETLAGNFEETLAFERLAEADYKDAHGEGHHEEHDDAEKQAATDGGQPDEVVTMDEEPPVKLSNLTPAKPFEVMVKMVNQPKYSELDPTLLVFLTFPFAFGFMIGDIGYGILYMAMGYAIWGMFDSDAGKAIGTIAIWAGVFTILFGYLYDDIFGIHMSDVGLELPLAGTLTKGLQLGEWALLWIIASILFGILHLNAGLVMGFVNEFNNHGLKAAIYERLAWIFALNGLFAWIFSLHLVGEKPDFLVGTEGILYEFVGFAGLPEAVGMAGLAIFLLGSVLVGIGEGIAGIFEIPAWAFGHVLSYLRMVAVLLAKGGMAFVVNLLTFGAYATPDGYVYFDYPGFHIETVSGYEMAELTPEFVGLIHAGDGPLMTALALVGAVLVFVLGHILVLLLGITAAGIQMLRLEYVEFFQKFYEGGGEEYEPFGQETPTE